MMEAIDSPVAADALDYQFRAAMDLQGSGNDASALAAYETVLAIHSRHVGTLVHAAALALDMNRDEAATRFYRQLFDLSDEVIVAAVEPVHARPDAMRSLILLCGSTGRDMLAAKMTQVMARQHPEDLDLRLMLGRKQFVDGHIPEAIQQFRQATRLAPDSSEAWAGFGAACMAGGDRDEARQALERALDLAPDNHRVRCDLIAVLQVLGRNDLVLAHYGELARRIDGDNCLLGQIGIALLAAHDPATALVAFERLLQQDGTSCLAGLGMGAALLALEDEPRAVACLEQAIGTIPRDPGLLHSLARDLANYLPRQLLNGLLNIAVDLAWDDADVLRKVADLAYHERYGNTAIRGMERLRSLVPDDPKVLPLLIDARLSVCDWGDGGALAREVLAAVDARMDLGQPLDVDVWNLFALGVDYPTLARAARYKSAEIETRLAPLRTTCAVQPRAPEDGRIRLGYLCPYTNKTSHIDNLLTVVRRHDRERFALYGYSIGAESGDDFEQSFTDCFDGFRFTPLRHLEDSARQIRDDRIDILFDSTGHFSATCMPLAALRPASVVVHGAAGFNIIGGAPFFDYSLNDRHYLRDELVELYLEKPLYMPHSAMPAELLPIANASMGRPEFGIPDEAFVFCDFNHPCKFDPTIFAAWMAILRRVPGSVLLLGDWFNDTVARLHELSIGHDVDPARVIFMPLDRRERHLRRLQLCDLALDTFYHCGGVTTVDCLIAGLPILTALPDRSLPLANRSLLAAMDLDDMVMPDLDSYIERAVALANAPDELAAIRARMQVAHHSAPLFQADRWVRNLERSCEIMHRRHCDGDAPAPFSVLDVQDWPDRAAGR